MQTILAFLGFAVSGAVGWFVSEFVARPIRSFFDLRKEVRQQMLFLSNVVTDLPKPFVTIEDKSRKRFDQLVEAKQRKRLVLRELGTKLLAYADGEPVAAFLLRKLGYDPRSAGSALIGLSNNLGQGNERATFSTSLKKALRFAD